MPYVGADGVAVAQPSIWSKLGAALLSAGQTYAETLQTENVRKAQEALARAEEAKAQAIIAQSQVTPGATTQAVTRTLLYGGVALLGAVVAYKLIAGGGSSYTSRRRYRR